METLIGAITSIGGAGSLAPANRSTSRRPNRIGASQRLNRVQEQERGRVAREVHDELGTLLALERVHIGRAMELLGAASLEPAIQELQGALQISARLTEAVRDIQVALRPESLDDLGLAAAAQSLCQLFGRAGLEIELETRRIEGRRFSTDVETTAFRILEHALTNVLRHSGVRKARATLEIVKARSGRRLRVTVEDEGKGFAAKTAANRSGIVAMHDRAAVAGGTLILDTAPRRGTRVIAELPISGAKTAGQRG